MPLTGTVRNQITGQIDVVFDAIAAGTAYDNHDWIHQAFQFSAGGFTYDVTVLPAGDLAHPSVVMNIQRRIAV